VTNRRPIAALILAEVHPGQPATPKPEIAWLGPTDVRIVAWGNLLALGLHAGVIAALSLNRTHPLHAFALTGDGAPIHPLARGRSRVPLEMPLIEWRGPRPTAPATEQEEG
jgi:hypothetical protein